MLRLAFACSWPGPQQAARLRFRPRGPRWHALGSSRQLVASAVDRPLITSLQNPRVRAARGLLRRRNRSREGSLLAEGHRLVLDAVHAGCTVESLFYTKEALARGEYGRQLQSLIERNVHSLLAKVSTLVSPEVIESISDTVTPQGCVAVVSQPRKPLPEAPSLLLVCDNVRDPGNVGTLLRAAAGAGADGVILSAGCADPWGLKALRAGMGAQLRFPVAADLSWDEISSLIHSRGVWNVCVADGDHSGDGTYTATERGGLRGTSYTDFDWTEPAVIIVGSEATGPSAEAYKLSSTRVSIPMYNNIESLNAGVAGAVILFEASRQRTHCSGDAPENET